MRRLPLSTGSVVVAVATTATTPAGCAAQARAAARAGADVIELRADLLADLEPVGRLAGLCAGIASDPAGAPVLLTVRTAAEGGRAPLDDARYRTCLFDLVAALAPGREGARPACADAVDIELNRGGTAELVAAVHEIGLDALVSVHDFAATPEPEEMLSRLHEMALTGADAVKLAVTPRDARDVARLLEVTALAARALEVPVVTMSMGRLGAVSRVAGAVFGSAMTFATAGGEPSAPGQPPIEELRRAMALLGGPAPSSHHRPAPGEDDGPGPGSPPRPTTVPPGPIA